ncbi:MAG: hypothetical protein K0Q73_7496 [Paenibacillus sp.]|jgi:hypothetical protein|nr:hypothetical protein [Paenibacillus sp.]
MGDSIRLHMMNKPYVCTVICELQILGYPENNKGSECIDRLAQIRRTCGQVNGLSAR